MTTSMANPTNLAIVRQLYEEAFNSNGDPAVIDEFVAFDLIEHGAPAQWPAGRAGFKQRVAQWRRALPDSTFTIELLIAQGEWVALAWRCTSPPPGAGAAAIGILSGITLNRIVDGRLAEHWAAWNECEFLRQVGII